MYTCIQLGNRRVCVSLFSAAITVYRNGPQRPQQAATDQKNGPQRTTIDRDGLGLELGLRVRIMVSVRIKQCSRIRILRFFSKNAFLRFFLR